MTSNIERLQATTGYCNRQYLSDKTTEWFDLTYNCTSFAQLIYTAVGLKTEGLGDSTGEENVSFQTELSI